MAAVSAFRTVFLSLIMSHPTYPPGSCLKIDSNPTPLLQSLGVVVG